MLRLTEASFPTEDSELLPKAGSCLDCPKRTGNQRDLFPDIKSADVCTDPPCFAEKQEANWERIKDKAESAGKKILPDKDSKILQYGYVTGDKYIDVAHRHTGSSPENETWRKLLGKAVPQIFVARDDQGKVHELAIHSEALAVLEGKYKWVKKSAGAQATSRDQKSKEQDKLDKLVRRRVLAGMAEAIPGLKPGKEFWKVLALCAVERAWADTVKSVVQRLGLEVEKKEYSGLDFQGALLQAIESMTTAQLRNVVAEILTLPFIDGWDDKLRVRLEKLFKVNRAAITRKAKAELKKKPVAKNQKPKTQKEIKK